MNRFSNPLVWLVRIRHRCGYGVHSPFAFRFLTGVVYERTPYYAYATLDPALPWGMRLRRKKGLHLLLRLANWLQPQVVVAPGDASFDWRQCSACWRCWQDAAMRPCTAAFPPAGPTWSCCGSPTTGPRGR